MNCASARCRRTIAPRSTTKRAPESLAAASKSMPAFTAGISKCSRGREVEGAGRAPAAELDVRGLVRAVGHLRERQVRQAQEQVGQALVLGLRLLLQPGDLVLRSGDERAQALELGLVAAGLGGADVLRGGVALGQQRLGRGDLRAPRLVDAPAPRPPCRSAPGGAWRRRILPGSRGSP
jgi:hypothetical protein